MRFGVGQDVTEDPSASGGAARDAPLDDADRSRSPSPAPDPLKFSAWNVIDLDQIPFDKIVFSPDIALTSNRAYHPAAILFFLAPELPLKFPQVKDALHAGWMAVFRHPMNFEELRRPPCVGEGAYDDEEQQWCAATVQFLVDSLDPAGRLSRGIPENAVSRRTGRPRAAAAAAPSGALDA
jgi:hypothetical protein